MLSSLESLEGFSHHLKRIQECGFGLGQTSIRDLRQDRLGLQTGATTDNGRGSTAIVALLGQKRKHFLLQNN